MSLETQLLLNALHDDLNGQTKGKYCRRCRGMVWVAWIEATWAIRCNCYPLPPQMVQSESYYETWKRGGVIPIHIQNNLEKKFRRHNMTTAITRAEVQRHISATFGSDFGTSELDKAMKLVELGLDHTLHLVVYQGRITTNIDGLYFWARQHIHEPWEIVSEPIMGSELREAYGVGNDEIGVLAKLYRVAAERPAAVGFGRASKNSYKPVMKGSAVESSHPYRMAEKRAEAQAIRKFAALGKQLMPAELLDTENESASPNVVEGSAAPVEMGAEIPAADGWETTCQEHEINWEDGQWGWWHKSPKGQPSCSLKKILKPIVEEFLIAAGEPEDLNSYMKLHYGATWSGASDVDRLGVMLELKTSLEAQAVPEPPVEVETDESTTSPL